MSCLFLLKVSFNSIKLFSESNVVFGLFYKFIILLCEFLLDINMVLFKRLIHLFNLNCFIRNILEVVFQSVVLSHRIPELLLTIAGSVFKVGFILIQLFLKFLYLRVTLRPFTVLIRLVYFFFERGRRLDSF
jgi:hypothetical protein